MTHDYSIYLLECGHIDQYPQGGIFYGLHNAGTLRIPFCYIALRSSEHVILIDTGYKFHAYGRELAELFAVEGWVAPEKLLAEVGITPEQVSAVIVTHAHWDHMGNLEAFPNAEVILQRLELERWSEVLELPERFSFLRGGLDPSDIAAVHERALSGRLRLVDGDVDDVLPGIDVRLTENTHTLAHQVVIVRTPDGPFVATGDCVYSYRNLTGLDGSGAYVPIGTAMGSQAAVLQTFDRVMAFAEGDLNRIIPVHDDEAWDRFPSRQLVSGGHVAEVALAKGARSWV
jgi:N-acyl homoserine lactone hydrolase